VSRSSCSRALVTTPSHCDSGRAALDDAAQTLTFGSRMLLKRALGRSSSRERRPDAVRLLRHRSNGADVAPKPPSDERR
jgi:hypothetical protein